MGSVSGSGTDVGSISMMRLGFPISTVASSDRDPRLAYEGTPSHQAGASR